MNSQQLTLLDHSVLIGYFALILVVSLYLILKERKTSKTDASSEYFLGGKNLSWFVIGASLFASNIGSEHLVGLAGAGASGDFPAAQFEILAAFMLLLLGWLFVPLYLRSGVFTLPYLGFYIRICNYKNRLNHYRRRNHLHHLNGY
jgi:SSS family solute:Na+ symporter